MKTLLVVLSLLITTTWARFAGQTQKEESPPLSHQMRPDQLPKMRPLRSAVSGTNCHPSAVDLMFVVDESSSVGSSNFRTVLAFLNNVVSQLEFPGARVGMVVFSSTASVSFDLDTYSTEQEIENAISNTVYHGGQTDIALGMNLATSRFTAALGDRASVDDVMLVLTDGQDNSDVISANKAAEDKGIKVIAVGVGYATSYAELMKIAGGDQSLVFDVATFTDLNGIVVNITCDFDPCDGNPCLHEGTCTSTNNGTDYTCHCTPQYAGLNCQDFSNECTTAPCENEGTCVSDTNGYHCLCKAGYTGTNCENTFCQHGGKFHCECPYGYTGAMCEDVINFCEDTDIIVNGTTVSVELCGIHGKCTNTPTGPVCTCDHGWTGTYCRHDVINCDPNPCEHGGTCVEEDGDAYHCLCPPLYTGLSCEHSVDFCNLEIINGTTGAVTPVPTCSGHGSCQTTPSGSVCVCDSPWTGAFCDTQILESCTHAGHTYPHNSTWVSNCDTCSCEYGVTTCSASLWCPQRCAIYSTPAVVAKGITVGCPLYQNCIPDNKTCAHETPSCVDPSGWCFPVGYVMVDTLTLPPTNPPNGYKPF